MIIYGLQQSSKQKLQANISVLVLFLLVVSSLIGLMTVSYVRQMIAYNSSISQYYKAYYMARAGLELGLVAIQDRGLGYEMMLTSGDRLAQFNTFVCPGGRCLIASQIEAMSTGMTRIGPRDGDCTTGNAYRLSTGQSLIIPLFADSSTSLLGSGREEPLSNVYITPSLNITFLDPQPSMLGVGLGIGLLPGGRGVQQPAPEVSDDDVLYMVISGTNNYNAAINTFVSDNKKFARRNNVLVISNPALSGQQNQGLIQLCLSSLSQEIPLSVVTVTAWGQIGDRYVGIQALKNIALPDYILQTYIIR